MNNYIIKMPSRYYQGYNIIKNLGEYTNHLGSNCIVLISKNGYDRYNTIIRDSLKDLKSIVFITTDDNDYMINDYINSDFIIGVGGGTILDNAKYIANKYDLPCVTIPTVLSSDAASNSLVVPKKYDDRDTMMIRCKRNPEVVIADTKILLESPVRYLISGLGDALATYIESKFCYLTSDYTMTHGNTPDSFIPWSLSLYKSILTQGYNAVQSIITNNLTSSFEDIVKSILFDSSVLSENCGLSLPHAFSLAVDEVFPDNELLHGEKVAYGLLFLLYIVNDTTEFKYMVRFLSTVGLLDNYNYYYKNEESLSELCKSVSYNKLSRNVYNVVLSHEFLLDRFKSLKEEVNCTKG